MDKSKNTAIARRTMSKPCKYLLEDGSLKGAILDYGCGRGVDVKELKKLGFNVTGYDPHHGPKKLPRTKFNHVLMTYVVNVIEDVTARDKAILDAFAKVKTGGWLYITVRSPLDVSAGATKGNWKQRNGGYGTSSGTFQRSYSLRQLEALAVKLGLNSGLWCTAGNSKIGGNMLMIRKG